MLREAVWMYVQVGGAIITILTNYTKFVVSYMRVK